MNKHVIFGCLVWIVLILSSLILNLNTLKKHHMEHTTDTARGLFKQISLLRLWNSKHGGVYVPISQKTKPNIYLSEKEREINAFGKEYTKINPSHMTRELLNISNNDGNKFRVVGIKPVNPANNPDQYEKELLIKFQKGLKEHAEFTKGSRLTSFFYMAPLINKKSCLKCHEEHGYKKGGINGAISIRLDSLPPPHLIPFISLHLIILITGLAGITFYGFHMNKAYRSIKKQAVIDTLTGIPNRRSFSKKIAEEIKRSKRDKYPLAIIMGDIDNFKLYNDTYGHKYGDECIKKVAQTIKRSLKRPGDFCARYGGEEFIIILPGTHSKGAEFIGKNILKNIKNLQIRHSGSETGYITISLGICAYNMTNDITHEELISKADKAMYIAKNNGKNRIKVYSKEVDLNIFNQKANHE